MRLPGTRYQEPGWEDVRKLLGQCSLAVLRACAPADAHLDAYVDAMAHALHGQRRGARAEAAGNSYGDSVAELALALVYELGARATDWDAFQAALAQEAARGVDWQAGASDGLLRKKINDMYAVLRDRVDADNYQAACGRPCSANRMYAYRMLDTAYGELARLFGNWRAHRAQVGAILGRELADGAAPIEVRQLRAIGDCRPEWILRWSATLETFGCSPGPLHTRSKRFASLKTSPEKIGAMLREIGDYEALSANRDRDWLQDADDASAWMEDYWRVLQQSQEAQTPGPDRILEAREDEFAADAIDAGVPADVGSPPAPDPAWCLRAADVSLPPGYMEAAQAAEPIDGWVAQALAADGLPVRLSVYAQLLGPDDESYPSEWRDPATSLLPTLQQLAGLAGISLPTLRKRRDAAILRLHAADQPKARNR